MQEMEEADILRNIIIDGLEDNKLSEIKTELENMNVVQEENISSIKGVRYIWVGIGLLGILGLIYLYFFLISLGTYCFSSDFDQVSLFGIIISAGIIGINIFLLIAGLAEIRFRNRYNKIYDLLKYHTIMLTEELALYSDSEEYRIIKDLHKAIQYQWIPEGHFGENETLFFLTDDSYDKYENLKEAFEEYYKVQKDMRLNSEELAKESEAFKNKMQLIKEEFVEKSSRICSRKVLVQIEQVKKDIDFLCYEVNRNPENAEDFEIFFEIYYSVIKAITEKIIEDDIKELRKIMKLSIDFYENMLVNYFRQKEIDLKV